MKTITNMTLWALAASFVVWGAAAASAHDVPGQKLDSGLGELPPYRLWDDPSGRQPLRHRVVGESLDDGLGQLPHYREWDDPTGRQPIRPRVIGESLDDGLGELPPYSQWRDKSGRDPLGRGTTLARR